MLETDSRFVMDANSMFICGTPTGAVVVFDAGSDLNSKSYSRNDWKVLAAAIGTNKPITKCETIPCGTKVYRAVEIFGVVIKGDSLDRLSEELFMSQVLVNPDGYQVSYSGEGDYGGFDVSKNWLVKANNMFGWMRYGVKSPEGRTGTVWNRYDMRGGETVVDYVAAEEKAKLAGLELEKQRRELREWERKAAEKEEILGHYKLILEEKIEIMKEMENGKNRLKEVLEEKVRVNEEQRRVIKEKEVEIQGLMMVKLVNGGDGQLKEKVMVENDDDDFKAAIVSFTSSCKDDLNRAIGATNRVLFVNLVVAFLLLGLLSFRLV